MNQEFLEQDVIIVKKGVLGVITLNRPKALNALTLEMIRQISSALKEWEKDANIHGVFFRGAGGRAFCAGGDLKAFHRLGMDFRRGDTPHSVPSVFFAEEYSLNRQIFHYSKPTIAFMNGITMGGGYGIAGNCRHRIATEKTVFAMPETGIGFFPDVGSVYHLLRTPHATGHYLALTGSHVGPGDMLFAGLADFFVPSDQEEGVIEKLKNDSVAEKIAALANVWRTSIAMPESTELKPFAAHIKKTFSGDGALNILESLERDSSGWANKTHEVLCKRSPSSVCVTAAHLKKSKGRSFDEIIRTDFILAQRFLERMDLYEGIRAVLIDKDNKPVWEPARIEDIGDDYVRRYFEPTGYSLEDVRIFAS